MPLHIRLFCCGMALLVLLASTGFGLAEHWCQMRGYTKTLLVLHENCEQSCTSAKQATPVLGKPVVKKQGCCKTTLTYAHLDVSRSVTDGANNPAPQPAAYIPNPEFRLLLAALLPTGSPESIRPDSQPPLPRTGRHRLASFCTWLL